MNTSGVYHPIACQADPWFEHFEVPSFAIFSSQEGVGLMDWYEKVGLALFCGLVWFGMMQLIDLFWWLR